MSRRNSSPAATAKYSPCHTAGPTRWGRFAPLYWATNVDVYPAVTWRTPKNSQNHMTAGNEAVMSAARYHDSSRVSTNTCTVMKLWLRISGRASRRSSRDPPGTSDATADPGDGSAGGWAVSSGAKAGSGGTSSAASLPGGITLLRQSHPGRSLLEEPDVPELDRVAVVLQQD